MPDHEAPQSRNEAILQNILGEHNELLEPQSRNEAILQAILYGDSYTEDAQSRIETLLLCILNGTTTDLEPLSRNEEILIAKINGGTYDKEPQSRIEELLIEWLNAFVEKTVTGAVCSFDDAIAGQPFISLSAEITPQQAGSGDPSPSNVRPISGFTGVHIGYVDFNQKLYALGSDSWESNDATFSDGVCTWTPTVRYSQVLQKNTNEKKIYIEKGHVYFFSVEIQNANTQQLNIYTGGAYWLAGNVQSATYKKYTSILTASITSGYWRLIIQTNASSDWGTLNIKNIQIFDLTQMFGVIAESVTTDVFVSLFHKDYYAKTDGGTLVTVNSVNGDNLCPNAYVTWQTEAGTVYFGWIDLTTGVLTVTHTMCELTGTDITTVTTEGGLQRARLNTSGELSSASHSLMKCNMYKPQVSAENNIITWVSASQKVIWIYDSRFTDLATAQSILNSDHVILVYPLATPQTYQLTPTEVLALLGANNIYSNTGNTTVKYKARG